jgi:RND family efflux transporter MFP subunit
MKKAIFVLMVAAATAAGVWYWPRRQPAEPHAGHERKVLYYIDPMHPTYKSDKPGIAPDCGMKLVPVYADDQPTAAAPAGTVKLTTEKQQLIGVRTGTVEWRNLTRTIRAVGKVDHDETRVARIHAKVDGWIERVFVDFTGQLVNQGEPLVSIYSPELFATQQEFLLAARARKQLAGSTVAAVASGGESLYEAARKRLQLWDISDEQIREIEARGEPQKNLTLYAPVSGYVLARNAYPKQRLTPDTELYQIADHTRMWVIAEVYEYEFPLVRIGMPAEMSLPAAPNRKFRGAVTYIYPEMQGMTRTVKVRLEFPNPEHLLRPEMFATVELVAGLGRRLVVPEDAVLDSGEERIVFVDHGNGQFVPHKVETGERVGGWYAIHRGLKAGDRVVTSGNFLLDSESRLKAALAGMSAPAKPAGEGGHRHD